MGRTTTQVTRTPEPVRDVFVAPIIVDHRISLATVHGVSSDACGFRASMLNSASSVIRYVYARDLNSTAKMLIRLDSHATSYSMRMSPIRIQ